MCVLWTAAPAPPPALTDLLAQRGFHLEPAGDRFSAMAGACAAAKAGQRPVLILDQPDRLKGSAALIEAVRGRLPDAVIWTYDPSRKPQLRGLDGPPSATGGSNRPPNGTVQAQIPLRLVGEPGAAGEAAEHGDRRSVLSAEELEMLLADEPERE